MRINTININCAAFIITLAMLMGCQTAKEQNAEDFGKIKHWEGQNVQVAIDTLGVADKITTTSKNGHIYYWMAARYINPANNKSALTVQYGRSVTYAPAPVTADRKVACGLKILTDPDNIILHYHVHGNTLACRELARKIGDADDVSASHDAPNTPAQ